MIPALDDAAARHRAAWWNHKIVVRSHPRRSYSRYCTILGATSTSAACHGLNFTRIFTKRTALRLLGKHWPPSASRQGRQLHRPGTVHMDHHSNLDLDSSHASASSLGISSRSPISHFAALSIGTGGSGKMQACSHAQNSANSLTELTHTLYSGSAQPPLSGVLSCLKYSVHYCTQKDLDRAHD